MAGWADEEFENSDGSADFLFVVLPEDIEDFPELGLRKVRRMDLFRLRAPGDGSEVFEVEFDGALLPEKPVGVSAYDLGKADAVSGRSPAELTPGYLRGYADGLDSGKKET